MTVAQVSEKSKDFGRLGMCGRPLLRTSCSEVDSAAMARDIDLGNQLQSFFQSWRGRKQASALSGPATGDNGKRQADT